MLIFSLLFHALPSVGAEVTSAYSYAGLNFFYVLVLAVAGGLILNLMPCVLPVLSIKVLSLIKHGEYNSLTRKFNGLAYTAGIIISFLVFAGTLLGLRASGEAAGWGFQLQSPWFVATLIYLFYIMGLGLSGFVEIGASLANVVSFTGNRSGMAGSFLNGILASVVATPCTAPFMGTAMGYAMSQPTASALLVFAALGLGLASPFLIIAFIPALARLLPRPGHWMETLKQFFAFPLYLTSIWLLWVLNQLSRNNSVFLVLAGLVMITFALWLLRLGRRGKRPYFVYTLAFIALLGAVLVLPAPGETEIRRSPTMESRTDNQTRLPYSEQILQRFVGKDRIVFVNLTADWCITCKVNEHVAINDQRVITAFKEKNVVYIIGDWTNGDENIGRMLERFGRSGVPLYLLYLPGKTDPIILPQILTPEILIRALES